MTETTTQSVQLPEADATQLMLGAQSATLRTLERALEVTCGLRGETLTIQGSPPDVRLAARAVDQLYKLAKRGYALVGEDVERALAILVDAPEADLTEIYSDAVFVSTRNKVITPKTLTQKFYLDTIRRHDLTFGIGPAGTGKTFLAVAMAMSALQEKRVRRVILTRPAVEAGEKLGFLPGDLAEKVNPYLRPLLDAMQDLVDPEKVKGWLERGTIEIAPLAFMRGRTLNDAFIILDEAQNTTREQMKMFLTRMGFNSCAVVTGDVTQIDLDRPSRSGLVEAQRVLGGLSEVGLVHFSERDVVRHSLVQRIIQAYEADASERMARRDAPANHS